MIDAERIAVLERRVHELEKRVLGEGTVMAPSCQHDYEKSTAGFICKKCFRWMPLLTTPLWGPWAATCSDDPNRV